MTTKQLAIYCVNFVAAVAVFFGLVPPLLNAQSTPLNALGAAVVLVTVFASILTVHATYTQSHNTKEKKS